jgi:hypothetical protein
MGIVVNLYCNNYSSTPLIKMCWFDVFIFFCQGFEDCFGTIQINLKVIIDNGLKMIRKFNPFIFTS